MIESEKNLERIEQIERGKRIKILEKTSYT